MHEAGLAVRYRVTGMDCARDAAEIEQAARTAAGVESAKVSVATQVMTVQVTTPEVLPAVEEAVAGLGYRLDRGRGPRSAGTAAARANARAVWLFSRNDALGNLAVVVAAGLVAWTGTPWPDLVVAVVIAGLSLQSSWSIVRDARNDLREAGA